ncbi:hypothetical protein [Streptomyces sp. NPDC002132]|uniref:hypothetical protein n=1 Tax=unclassified Streptomyces TaxID=2593676 RepID=UPI0033318911
MDQKHGQSLRSTSWARDRGQAFSAGGDLAERRHAKADRGGSAGCFGIELSELVLDAGEADLKTLHFVQPAFVLDLGDPGDEVVADLDESFATWSPRSRSSRAKSSVVR